MAKECEPSGGGAPHCTVRPVSAITNCTRAPNVFERHRPARRVAPDEKKDPLPRDISRGVTMTAPAGTFC